MDVLKGGRTEESVLSPFVLSDSGIIGGFLAPESPKEIFLDFLGDFYLTNNII